MKINYWIFATALIISLVVLTTLSVSSVSASGNSLPAPEGTPPPPTPKPDPGTPETTGGDNDGGGEKKNIFQVIRNIIFDYKTMSEAIVETIKDIFNDAATETASESGQFYLIGEEISRLVFQTDKLKDVRRDSWLSVRKVAFALLPMVAALTIWASMKDGLYSVTGYANTLEAVTEFVVSIAIALASLWLMEQTISLTKSLTLAIADGFPLDLNSSVFTGLLINTFSVGSLSPVLSMLFSIIAFVFLLVFMTSILLAFLAREVVIVIAVALAPLMIILGSVRPLGWLRALWSKAFIVFLLILPLNVLLMGVSAKLLGSAGTGGQLSFMLHLIIMAGTISILVALNTTLGKLVFGAAIEVAEKVGTAVASVGAMATGVALGVGTMGAGGLAAAGGTLGSSGGGSGGALAESVAGGANVTSTSNLTSTIGSVLGSSGNPIVKNLGKGIQAGNAVRDSKIANQPYQSSSPPINFEKDGMPGYEDGINDVKSLYQGDGNAVTAIGQDEAIINDNVDMKGNTTVAVLRAAQNAGIPGPEVTKELGVNRNNLKLAGRELIRKEVGSGALGKHSPFQQNQLHYRMPNTPNLHPRDFAATLRIVKNEQKHSQSAFRDPDVDKMGEVARAVQARRLSGMAFTDNIISSAQSENLQNWIDDSLGNI